MVRVVVAIAVLLGVSDAYAEERATVQDRFAPKVKSFYVNGLVASHLRNDFYDSFGVGIDTGFYPIESLGIELRGVYLHTTLGDEARSVQERTGLTPDARPQQGMVAAGLRWSLGYGKLLLFDDWVVHFDPQLTLHGGVAMAETRVLPTLLYGFSFLTHWRWGIQVKLDLNLTTQVETRDRGRVTTLGFMPILGVGWTWRGGP